MTDKSQFDELNDGGINHKFLFTLPDPLPPAACEHHDCILMRENFLLLAEYGDDPRVKTLSESQHFGRLAAVAIVVGAALGHSPEAVSLVLVEAGRTALTDLMDRPNLTADDIRDVLNEDELLKKLAASPSWAHDAGMFVLVSSREGANPVTIAMGVMVLAYAFEDGKYKEYTPEANLPSPVTEAGADVLTGEDILRLAGVTVEDEEDEL